MDTNSLLIAHSVSLFTVSMLLCLVWLLRFPFRGPGWWTSAYLTAIAGVFLLSLRSLLPDFITIVFANFLPFLSLILAWNGLRLFLGKNGFTTRQWCLQGFFLATAAGLLYFFSAVYDIIEIRFVLWACLFSTIMPLTIRDVWPQRQDYRSIRLLACIYLSYTVLLIVRIILFIALPPENPWSSSWNHTLILINNMTFIATAFCFLMLISERLLHVIRTQYKELDENMNFRKQMQGLLFHDLASPMLPILYLPDLLLKKEQLSASGKNKILQIKTAAHLIMDLLNETLVMHKFETTLAVEKYTPVNVLSLIRKVNEDLLALQKEKNITLNLQPDPGLTIENAAVIQGDENLLYRMYANLLTNALQASPPQGIVLIRLQCENKLLRLAIQNQGEVPEELRPCFFEKYSRKQSSKGLGLGTFSAKLAVQAHGGDIALDSNEPGKTEITVWLPVTPDGRKALK